jgi:hypothetical protein
MNQKQAIELTQELIEALTKKVESLESTVKDLTEERDRLKEENKMDINLTMLNNSYEKGYSAAIQWLKDHKKMNELLISQRDKAIEEIKKEQRWGVAREEDLIRRSKVLSILSPKEKD